MVLTSEALILDVLGKVSGEQIDLIYQNQNKKRFTVKDSSLSYRQVNSLGAEDMLDDERANQRGWRKFSFKDLVYLQTVNEARGYGLQNSQLQDMKAHFYSEAPGKEETVSPANEMMLYVMGGITIFLMIMQDGTCYFTDMNFQDIATSSKASYLCMNFNEIVRRVWALTHKDGDRLFPKNKDWGDLLFDYFTNRQLTTKEKEILEILRKKNYTHIRIKKKGEDEYVIYGEAETGGSDISAEELIKLLESRDFGTLEVTKRDGKVANYKLEDVFKV